MFKSRFRGKTFGEILDMNRGAGLGFDFLRLALSVVIVLSHTSGLSGHHGVASGLLSGLFGIDHATTTKLASATSAGLDPTMQGGVLTGLARPITLSYVPMFFALSGFLVTGSAYRTRSLARFLGLRALRILPALLVEVVLSAFILGTIFTTLPLSEYFSSPVFWSYFWNILGEPHYFLPGVFKNTSTSPSVNSNLWTLPFELQCYGLMSLIMLSTLLKKPKIMFGLFVVLTIALLIANMGYGFQVTGRQLKGPVIVYYFLVGMQFYIWRYKIVFHEAMFVVAGLLSYGLMMFTNTVFIYPALLTYVTLFIGLWPFPQFKFLKSGDYSYGIYLYGYPVTQAFIAAFPSARSNLAIVAICSIAGAFAFAMFSWHAIEKHVLKLKRFISPKSSEITEKRQPTVAESEALVPGDTQPIVVGTTG